jgi:hypothetical protein
VTRGAAAAVPQRKAAATLNIGRVIAPAYTILSLQCEGRVDVMTATVTFIVTIFSALIIFIVSQYVLKLILEPISRLRRTLADISSTTLVYQAKITNGHAEDAIGKSLHELAARLRADASEGLFYSQVATLCGVPSEENIWRACQALNWLSTGMTPMKQVGLNKNWAEENTRTLEDLGRLLGIHTRF